MGYMKSAQVTSKQASFHFSYLILVTFGDEVTKIWKYYVIFVYIFPKQDGQDKKKRKENHASKVTEIPQTNIPKYGMNETLVGDFLFVTNESAA